MIHKEILTLCKIHLLRQRKLRTISTNITSLPHEEKIDLELKRNLTHDERRKNLLISMFLFGFVVNIAGLILSLTVVDFNQHWHISLVHLVMAWVYYLFHRMAKIQDLCFFPCLFSWVSLFEAGFMALYYGAHSGVELYVIILPLVAPLIFPPHQKIQKFSVLVGSFAVFAVLEVMLSLGFQGLVPLETDLQRVSFTVVSAFFCFLVFAVILLKYRSDSDSFELRLDKEKKKSDRLLSAILPESIIKRLKGETEEVIAESHDNVAVGFIDIVSFTAFSSRVSPDRVQSLLNQLFERLDAAAEELQIEKIKTIGDAYMFASGLFLNSPEHIQNAVRMSDCAHRIATDLSKEFGVELGLRIGISSGRVAGGIIGKKRFLYDIWGDTVNTASRMESHSSPKRTLVCEATAELLKDREFILTPREPVEVKGKGIMKTFYATEEENKSSDHNEKSTTELINSFHFSA